MTYMGRFNSNNRSGGFGRSGGNRGRSFGGDRDRGGFRGRDSRGAPEMHNVLCSKCGKNCQVPFKPTGEKPVYCSDCFRQNDDRGSRDRGNSSGASSEQFEQINAKLDKILNVLEQLEIADDYDDESEDENLEDEESEE